MSAEDFFYAKIIHKIQFNFPNFDSSKNDYL